MVGCSKNRKPACLSDSDCEWIVGKRCYSTKSKTVKPKKAKAKAKTVKPSLKSLEGHTVVFSGFRNAALASEIESKGAKVAPRVTSKTTLVVYKKTEKNASKLDELRKNKVALLAGKSLAKKFSLNYTPSPLGASAPKKPTGVKKATVNVLTTLKDANGAVMSRSAFPVKFTEANTIRYRDKFTIAQILRIAQKSVVSDHVKGEIRKLYGAIWYTNSKDMFMMMSRVKSETDPKNYDYVGVEFKFNAQNKIEYNASHPVIVSNVTKRDMLIKVGNKKMFDIKTVEPMIKEEYNNDILLLTMN